MNDSSWYVEYLHFSSDTIWSIAKELDSEELAAFQASETSSLVSLGYAFVCNASDRRVPQIQVEE